MPTRDNVIVEPIKLEQKGAFTRPQNEEDKAEIGRVISVGDTVSLSRIKPGDIVLFNKYSTTKIDIGDELIVKEEDIVAVLKRNGK